MKLAATIFVLGACFAIGLVAGAVVLAGRWLGDVVHARLARVIS